MLTSGYIAQVFYQVLKEVPVHNTNYVCKIMMNGANSKHLLDADLYSCMIDNLCTNSLSEWKIAKIPIFFCMWIHVLIYGIMNKACNLHLYKKLACYGVE